VGLVGAIIAMVIAGLIVYGIVYFGPDILQRIREGTAGGGTTSIRSITQNPEAYENQQVVVVGKVVAIMGFAEVIDDEGFYIMLTNVPSNFIAGGDKYKIWGKVVHVINFEKYWAIEISDIRKI